MSLIADLDELRRDAHPVGFTAHTALQNIVHAQLLPDLANVLFGLLVSQRRRPGDHAQLLRPQTTELRNHLLSQTVAEVILRRVGVEILKGQDGQHDLSGGRGCLRREAPPQAVKG